MFLFVQQKSVTLKKLFRNKDNLLMAYYSKTIQEEELKIKFVKNGLLVMTIQTFLEKWISMLGIMAQLIFGQKRKEVLNETSMSNLYS